MRLPLHSFALAALLCGSVSATLAALELPSIFGDHMVLQRARPAVVWGWAEPGEDVTVEFAGLLATATSDPEGRWEARLPALPASQEGRPLIIRSSSGAGRSFSNVVVGEVWVLAGQSNMGWSVGQSAGAADAAARASYPWLRSFNQLPNQGAADAPSREAEGGRWQPISPQIASRVSAVGFYFAEALRPALEGVPIGLVNTSMGGTSIESWIDLPTLEGLPAAQPGLNFYRQALVSYDQRMVEWAQAKTEWETRAQAARAAGRPAPPQDDFLRNGPLGPHHFRRPAALFNGKVAPLQPFAARGVIWYQGEGNGANPVAARNYGSLLSTLIERWREGWRDPELFFLIVQLPGYEHPNRQADWPTLRAQQAAVAAAAQRAALAVTIDLGDKDDIHPVRKQPVGERLASLAQRHVYGDEQVVAEAPRLASATRSSDTAILSIEAGAPLTTRDGGPLRGVEIAGPDKRFSAAEAAINDRSLVVALPPGGGEIHLRYAWANWSEANIQDATGLPLAPFETVIR